MTGVKLVEAGKLTTDGWGQVRATMLEARPLRCFRCLAVGHTRPRCTGPDRSRGCFNCGEEGHRLEECRVRSHCPLCFERGLKASHRPGSVACVPVPVGRGGRGGGNHPLPVEVEEKRRIPEGNTDEEEKKKKKRRMFGPLSKRQQTQSPLTGTKEKEEEDRPAPPLPQRVPREARKQPAQLVVESERTSQGPDPLSLPGKSPLRKTGSSDDTVVMSPQSLRTADSPPQRSPPEKRIRSEDAGDPEPGPSAGPSVPPSRKSESSPMPSRPTFAGFRPGFFTGGTKGGTREKASKGRGGGR